MKNITRDHILQPFFKSFIAVTTKRKQNIRKNKKQNMVSLIVQPFKIAFTSIILTSNLARNYMFKVNNKITRTTCEICSIKTQKDANGVVPVSLC